MTTPKPCTMPEGKLIEIICRRLHSQAYCNERVDDEWPEFMDDAREILSDIRRADLVEKIDGHGIDTTTEKS